MDELEPDHCYCFDCNNFRSAVESIRESLRWCSGDPRVGRPLIVARAGIKLAWVEWQERRRHEFVPNQEKSDDRVQIEDEGFASDEAESGTESAGTYSAMPPVNIDDMEFHPFDGLFDGHDDLTYYAAPEWQEGYIVAKEHKDQKIMTCDHCMAHGLPCNEAAVCNQCRYHKQPCVHRWCPLSPYSQALCPAFDCQYTHEDSTHYTFLEAALRPQWILKAGKFPDQGSRGHLLPRAWLKPIADDESPGWEQRLRTRQKEGLQELERRADRGETSHLSCACAPEQEGDLDIDAEDSRSAGPCPTCESCENYVALYRCGHWECHLCALKSIKEQKTCATCGATSFWLVFATRSSKPIHEFRAADFEYTDFKLGIAYETARIRNHSVWFLGQLRPASEGLLIDLE